MIYLTNQNIVHGDLRCGNVLVFQKDPSDLTGNIVKITNFKSAYTTDQSVTKIGLSRDPLRLSSTELLKNKNGSNDSDISSMGVLMWEACSKGKVACERRNSIDTNNQQQKFNNNELSQPNDCPDQLWKAIQYCWLRVLFIRLTFQQLKIELSEINFT